MVEGILTNPYWATHPDKVLLLSPPKPQPAQPSRTLVVDTNISHYTGRPHLEVFKKRTFNPRKYHHQLNIIKRGLH